MLEIAVPPLPPSPAGNASGIADASPPPLNEAAWSNLARSLAGELHRSRTIRMLYATDASSYREMPEAVAYPRNEEDLLRLLTFARRYRIGLVPRTAGTSLAGQVVGKGLVLDLSRHFTNILHLDVEKGTVRVQPGVIRDELNRYLAPHGLYFGPETSTANRAMIGGMVGNNACGSNSVVYGSTREHTDSVRAILADGSITEFQALSAADAQAKAAQQDLEGALYRQALTWKHDPAVQAQIRDAFPKADIPRRNTGYALDLLLADPGAALPGGLDFCRLLCGSEGTLALATEISLRLQPLPPKHKLLICAHFNSLDESLRANLVALQFQPTAVELMDHFLLDCTKDSLSQKVNRFFLDGEPRAVLVVELARHDAQDLEQDALALVAALQEHNFGYAYPLVRGEDIPRVWNLRKAGLGLLSNMPGDSKPVPVIEDTAVAVADLPAYIAEFNRIMADYGLYCVHYAHAGSGELHLRPILDLKTAGGQKLFRTVAEEVAALVKRYGGSLSGEHGDGRLRGEFLEQMVGPENFQRMVAIKRLWDPEGVLNPGKIVDTPPMDQFLRYDAGQETRTFNTVFRFRREQGIMRAIEQCNGSGDCRKLPEAGGTMCPSYQASREERDSTRARANALREVLTRSPEKNPFADPALEAVLDRCLSCKGCTGECPSNVDMARLKSEWLYQRYAGKGFPMRTRLFGHVAKLNEFGGKFAALSNFALRSRWTSPLVKRAMGVHPLRQLPMIHGQSLRSWMRHSAPVSASPFRGQVWLFIDPFSDRLDVPVGQAAVRLLSGLGYAIRVAPAGECGRTYLSKGMLAHARTLAERNVRALKGLVNAETPLLGIEPSSILTFRDEYPDLVSDELLDAARNLAQHCHLVEDFLAAEARAGRLSPDDFDDSPRNLFLHGHCHQKALVGVSGMAQALALPTGHQVSVLNTGCCGMAGSFGYEEEHYDLSMQIGEMVLFPALRKLPSDGLIAAPGTSCRHQIHDGTGKTARHPVEWLWESLRLKPPR